MSNYTDMSDDEFDEYIANLSNSEDDSGGDAGENVGDAGTDDNAPSSPDESPEVSTETAQKEVQEEPEQIPPQPDNKAQILSAAKKIYGEELTDDEIMQKIRDEVGSKSNSEAKPGAGGTEKGGEADTEEYKKIADSWQVQIERLKKFSPEFNAEQAFGNAEFYKKVVEEGMSITDAYMEMETANHKQAAPPTRIREGGAENNAVKGNVKGKDVGSMSEKEFDAYIKRIQDKE